MEPIHSHNGLAQHYSYNAGFTLIEMMVVLAIIAVISGIVLTSQNSFNKTLILSNTAYDIALSLRSAETFGIASRASGSISNTGYGLHFAKGTANSFDLFADISPSGSPGTLNCPSGLSLGSPDCKPGNGVYDSASDVLTQTYELRNGMTISDFCAGPPTLCSSALTSLDIVFARPNPTPSIRANGTAYSSACIKVTSPQGTSKYVSITSSGVISAKALSCP